MTVFIAIFETADQARDAYTQLTEQGFEESTLFVFAGSEDAPKLNAFLGSREGKPFAPMTNRLRNAVEAGHSALALQARLFTARPAEKTLEASGAVKVHTWTETSKFFSDVIGFNQITFRGRPAAGLLKNTHIFTWIPLLASPRGSRKSSFFLPLLTGGKPVTSAMPLLIRKRTKRA